MKNNFIKVTTKMKGEQIMIERNVKKEQEQLHSLLPLGEGGRRPDEGLKETVRCNSDEMLKQVQHDGKGLAKDAQSQCPPLETLPNKNNPVDCFCERKPKSPISRRGSERSELLTPHQGRLACTNTLATAKEVRSTSSCSFAPMGEGGRRPDEGSYQCDKTDMTPHQVRTKLAKRSLSPTILSPKGEEFHDRARHEAAEPKTCNHLITQSLSHLITSKAAAFTLAEVLITLAVIGIVAVLTIPNLMQNNNQKAWDTAADVFNKRLEVAARVMNTQETLAGYSNTKDFVTELKKHIKITRICDNDELTKCFPEKVFWGAEQEEIDVEKDIKNAKNMGQDNWGTEVIGAQFANGIDALIAYDPNCTQDPYNNQIQASNCMAILYDVSAKKNPNSYGKDLRANGNVLSLGGIECAFEVNGTCYTNPALPSPMTKAECEQAVAEGTLGIKACYYDNDYWAGAVKHCGGVQNMPTPAQLAEIATDLYGDHGFSTSGYEYKDGLTMDKTKSYVSILDAVYGDSVSGRPSGEFALWSGQESDGSYAYDRGFYSDFTTAYDFRTSGHVLAVCLGD